MPELIWIAIALVAAALIACCYVSSLLYRFAIPRKGLVMKPPKNKKQVLNPGWEAAMPLIEKGREYFASLPHEDMYITSFDGLKLHGYYFAVENAERTVLAVHGFRGSPQGDFGCILSFYLANGCNVLAIDQRAHGQSEGKHLTFGIKERFDCRDWAEFLAKRDDGLPIYLDGLSMGCATVLMTAGFTLPDRVKGIIADCGYTSPIEEFRHVLKQNYNLPQFPFVPIVWLYCRLLADFDINGYSTLDAMKTNKVPILFIHGGSDTFVPTRFGRQNYEACVAPKKLIIVESAVHALSYLTETQRCQNELKQFFAENDSREDR